VVQRGFTASGPTRVPDTRYGTGATRKPVGPGGVITLTLPAASATADDLVLNVTETGATADSYLTAYPGTGARPTASNLNFGPQLRPSTSALGRRLPAGRPAGPGAQPPSLTTRFEALAQNCPIPPMSCGDAPVGVRNDRARPGVVRTRWRAVPPAVVGLDNPAHQRAWAALFAEPTGPVGLAEQGRGAGTQWARRGRPRRSRGPSRRSARPTAEASGALRVHAHAGASLCPSACMITAGPRTTHIPGGT